MSVITSSTTVHLRPDRSITQLMLENPSNTNPAKVICEDILTGKHVTYGGLRDDAFKAAHSLRHRHGISSGDVVTIISRSTVRYSRSISTLLSADRWKVDYVLATHAIWAAGAVVRLVMTAIDFCKITHQLLLNSTINHSSATKELVHALKIVKPKMIIADAAVLNNLHQALATLDLNTPITILTLIERNAHYPLVSHFRKMSEN